MYPFTPEIPKITASVIRPAVNHTFPEKIKSPCVIFKSAPTITTEAPSPKNSSNTLSGIKKSFVFNCFHICTYYLLN